MNNSRRKELRRIIENFENEKQKLDIVINNEQDSFDNLTDSLQQTMRGQQMEEYIDKIEEKCGTRITTASVNFFAGHRCCRSPICREPCSNSNRF